MKRSCVGLVLLMFVLLLPALAYADSIATLDLSASFVPLDPSSGAATFGNGPSLFVTGQFTLDEDTGEISSWNISFLGPLGATYQLSPQNGGMASASCSPPVLPCGSISLAAWDFSFGNSTASLNLSTLSLPIRRCHFSRRRFCSCARRRSHFTLVAPSSERNHVSSPVPRHSPAKTTQFINYRTRSVAGL